MLLSSWGCPTLPPRDVWEQIPPRYPPKMLEETGREVVETNVGLVGKVNDDETELKSAREQIKEMAGTCVNVLTKEGRASLPADATKPV